jgi:tape measure domain-containing protein
MARKVIATAVVEVQADVDKFRQQVGGIGGFASTAFGKIKSVVGALGLGNAAKEAFDFGKKYTIQIDNAGAAVRGLVGNQKDADKLLKDMTNFAIQTPFDLPGVQNVTTRLLAVGKGFGVTKDNVIEYSRTLGNAAAANGKGSKEMLNVVNVMGRISGQGRIMTKDMNQLTANFPSLHPWEVLADVTGKSEEELRKLSVKPGGLSGIVEPGVVIDALNKKMKELPGAQKDMATGMDAMDRKMATFGGSMELMKDSLGVALASGLKPFFGALQKLMKDPAITEGLAKLAVGFGTLLSAVMVKLGPVIPKLVDSLVELLDAFLPLAPVVADLVQIFVDAMVYLLPVVKILVKFVDIAMKLIMALDPTILGAIAAALIVLWLAASGPVGPVIIAITAVIGLLAGLWNKFGLTEVLAKAIGAAWTWLFDHVFAPLGDWIMKIVHWFQDLYDKLIGHSIIPDLINGIVDWFKKLWEWLGAIIGTIRDGIVAVWDAIKTAVEAVVSGIATVIKWYFDLYWTIISTALEIIKAGIQAVWDAIKKAAQVAWDAIQLIVTGVWNALKAAAQRIFDGMKRIIDDVWTGIKTAARTAWNLIHDYIVDPITDAVDWVKDKIDSVVDFAKKLPGRMSNLFTGMWDGIKNSFKAAVNWLIGKWNGLSFHVGGGSFLGVDIPSFSLTVPQIPYLAKGALVQRPSLAMLAERGPEAVIPLTNPARAMQLMQQSGLDRLAAQMSSHREVTGPLVTMPGAIIQDATDADLVAQRTLVAMQAAMIS